MTPRESPPFSLDRRGGASRGDRSPKKRGGSTSSRALRARLILSGRGDCGLPPPQKTESCRLTLGLYLPSEKVGLGWVWRVQIPSEEVLEGVGSDILQVLRSILPNVFSAESESPSNQPCRRFFPEAGSVACRKGRSNRRSGPKVFRNETSPPPGHRKTDETILLIILIFRPTRNQGRPWNHVSPFELSI